MAGATAIQVGTANLSNPHISITILEGIEHFMRDRGIRKLTDLIGAANQVS
jgi:dihydroorotate dehydrogenase (NAD+) catalytic subunit